MYNRGLRAVPLGSARQILLSPRTTSRCFTAYNAVNKDPTPDHGKLDVAELLSRPTWSAASLLPPQKPSGDVPKITSKQLHHLLRLSALPPPDSAEEEANMLSTLQSQLHFVKEIQKVDTSGVEPLRSLRDETAEGEKEAELGLEAMKEALEAEEVRGTFHKRIKRRRLGQIKANEEEWDVLGCAEQKTGRYFVVESGKD